LHQESGVDALILLNDMTSLPGDEQHRNMRVRVLASGASQRDRDGKDRVAVAIRADPV
jgi:hypothetical protein